MKLNKGALLAGVLLAPALAFAQDSTTQQALLKEVLERLQRLDSLTPGDFAAVRQQGEILGETPDAEEFLEQLEAEHRVKPEVRQRRSKIGRAHV